DGRDTIDRALGLRQFVLTGPYSIGSGRGLVATLPIFLPFDISANDVEPFWGLARVAIDVDRLVVDTVLDEPTVGLRWALRGRDGAGALGPVFLGDPSVVGNRPET